MAIFFSPKYHKNYKTNLLSEKSSFCLQEPGWTIFLVFLSITGQFATQQNHDAQEKALIFSAKAVHLSQVQGFLNSEMQMSAFPYIYLSPHPTGGLASEKENMKSMVVILVSATATHILHT